MTWRRHRSGEVEVTLDAHMPEQVESGRRRDTPPAAMPSGTVDRIVPSDGDAHRANRLLECGLARCLAEGAEDGRPAMAEGWLHMLAASAHIALEGREPSVRDLPPSAPLRRLVGQLRHGIIAELRDHPEEHASVDVAAVLSALETVEGSVERDATRRFAGQFSDLDAMELVIAMAHDMRSPLASILFLVDTLRQGHSGAITPNQARQLLLIQSAAFGLGALTRDVIDLASQGSRLIESTPRSFSVRECLRSVEDVVRPMAEEKGLLLTLELPEIDLRVGQSIALGRVLLNLTTNALKFSEFGGVRLSARERTRTRIEFTVEDTGRGIPQDVLDTLFDAFRLRQRTQDYVFSAAGLGLSICQTLVCAMNSELSVTSEEGKGTRFSFQLELPPANQD